MKVKLAEELPDTSAIFDGTTVRLRAARGETVAFIVWRRADEPSPLGLELEDDAGLAVRGHIVEHQRVTRPSTRMYGPSRGAGEYPDKLFPGPSRIHSARRATLFDVAVSADAAPGVRTGTLIVDEQQELAVELTIDAATIPALDERLRVWAYYDEREVDRAGIDAGRMAEVFRRYGVAASPDLGVDDWDAHQDQLRGLPYVPVYLPKDQPSLARELPIWVDRLAGTGQVPFAIPIDEPRDDAARANVKQLADAARAAGSGPGRFLFGVTDQPREIYGDAIDVYLTPHGLMRDRPAEPQRWTYNGSPPFAGSMILDTDGIAMRTWGWIAWRWRVPLWYIWDAAYWTDRHQSKRVWDPEVDATTFDDGEDHGALDGVLFYPSGHASLRLVTLRRGLEDALLLEAVEACAGRPAAEAIAARIVPTALGDAGQPGDARPGSWPLDEATWEAARIALLDHLAACVRAR